MIRYTDEMNAFLAESVKERTHAETARIFHERFGIERTASHIAQWAKRRGIRRIGERVMWSTEMKQFIREVAPGRTNAQIAELFNERFGIQLRDSQIQNIKFKIGVKSGVNPSLFLKGRPSVNRGKKWSEYMSEEGLKAARKTLYSKGHVPHNALPIGTERVNQDGYIIVRIEPEVHLTKNDQWRFKHHLAWEKANGKKVPKGCNIVFADGDNRNFDPENLVCVSRADWSQLGKRGLKYTNRETLENAIAIARLNRLTYEKRCAPRECRVCGNTFKPRFPHQIRCDACLGRG